MFWLGFLKPISKQLSVRYVDNSDVVALIDGRGGVLDMLDEELTKPTSWDLFGERLGPRPRPLCSEINTLVTVYGGELQSLKLTIFAPENRPKRPKRKRSSSNHPFFTCELLVSGRVVTKVSLLSAFGRTTSYCCLKDEHVDKHVPP